MPNGASCGVSIDHNGTEGPPAMNSGPPRAAASAASAVLLTLLAALALGGCGGGGGGGGSPGPGPGAGPSPGPLLERADTLLQSGSHARWSLSPAAGGVGETITDSLVAGVTCAEARCVAADGTVTTARDLLGSSASADAAETTVGRRGGFDTAETRGAFEVSETLPGLALTVSPEVTAYGFWGVHGFAALALGTGALSAQIDGTSFSGDFSLAQAWTAGDAAGTNPAGTGRATWTGIAEASPTGAFGRQIGTATVTIADLSRPRVDVGIVLDGAPSPLRWADIPLAGGGFRSGTAGTDYLEGNFHGPGHEEAWGVFDTADWLGAFGAKRTP